MTLYRKLFYYKKKSFFTKLTINNILEFQIFHIREKKSFPILNILNEKRNLKISIDEDRNSPEMFGFL